MQVIINVDDFGMSTGINQAVINLNNQGIVKATSAFVNSPYLLEGLNLISKDNDLKVGLHLTLTMYQPLVDNQQLHIAFADPKLIADLPVELVYQEFKEQLVRFQQLTETLPTHLDTHYHLHLNYPHVQPATLPLATEYKLHLRGYNIQQINQCFCDSFVGDNATVEFLIKQIEDCQEQDFDSIEVMSHAAIVDQELEKYTSMIEPREVEYNVLSSNQFKSYIQNNNIEITTFKQ